MSGGGLFTLIVLALIVLFFFSVARLIAKLITGKTKEYPIVYLDTETTGLRAPPQDEVVEISIIDDTGNILLNSLVKPTKRKRWDDAQAIHGISPQMVANAPTMKELAPLITAAIKDKHLVIYNLKYDSKFISDYIKSAARTSCCMLRYSDYIGEWDSYHKHNKWHKLTVAAEKAGHQWQGDAHRALADTQATRTVWQWLDSQGASDNGSNQKKGRGCLFWFVAFVLFYLFVSAMSKH